MPKGIGMDADPDRKLVAPRILALIITLPLLTVIADVVGIIGGWTVSIVYFARLDEEEAVAGADDARDARWFAVDSPPHLAFDHELILADALTRVRAA